MDLQKILDNAITEKRWEKIIDAVATKAEAGDVKATEFLVKIKFFPPTDKVGQLKLDFTQDNTEVIFRNYE
jgi:hypothetical protein